MNRSSRRWLGHSRKFNDKKDRPLSWKPDFYRPRLEFLENRIAPTVGYVPLANLLTFYGNYNPTSATAYAFDTSAGPIQIGTYDGENHANFKALLQVTDSGPVTFDTEDNDTGKFNFTGALQTVPTNNVPATTLMTGTNQELVAQNLVNNNFSQVGGGAGVTIPLGFASVVINSFGLGTDPGQSNAPALLVHGEIDIPLPGSSGGNGGAPGENKNQIAIGIQGSDTLYLYVTTDGGLSVDISGASISVTESFTWAGITFAPQGLTLDVSAGGDGTFSIYGSVKVSTESADTAHQDQNFALDVTFSAGGPSNPGFAFTNWSLTNFDLTVNGGITFGGFKLQAKDLHVNYSSSDDTFIVNGGISLNLQAATFTVSLTGPNNPDGDSAGLIIKDGVPQFNGLTLQMSDLNLGAFKITNLYVSFSYSGSEFSLAAGADISLPGGWGVGGGFQFTYGPASGFTLNYISAFIDLSKMPEGGVPIGPTEIFADYLSATLSGLGTQNWSISGQVGVAFGQTIDLPKGKSVRIVQAVGGFSLDKNKLVLSGSVGFGAAINANGQITTSILGTLTGNVTLDWANEVYSAEVDGNLLGVFTFSGSFKYNQGNIFFQATAGLQIPPQIPLIGGDQLFSAQMIFEYAQSPKPVGLIAGWVHLPIIGNAGVEYNFETGEFSFIGNSAVQSLESMQPQFNTYAHQFTIPDPSQSKVPPAGAETFNFIVQWVTNGGGSYYVVLTGPGGTNVKLQSGSITVIDYGVVFAFFNLPSLSAPPGQAITGLQANNAPTAMTPGIYTLTLYTQDTLDPNAIVWTGLGGYSVPNGDKLMYTVAGTTLTATAVVALDTAFESTATASLYLDTAPQGYEGVKIATTSQFTPDPGHRTGIYTISFSTDLSAFNPNTGAYYLYVVINDGIDAPNTTPYSPLGGFTLQPQLTGTLLDTGDGRSRPLSGFTVYLDLNSNGQLDPGEPTTITAVDGSYWFYSSTSFVFQSGTGYTVGLILPATGYQTVASFPTLAPFTYSGSTATVDFQVWQKGTVAGSVFEDINQNGILDPGEPGVPGVNVSDLFGNVVTTLNDGSFEIIGLQSNLGSLLNYQLPPNYLASGVTQHYYTIEASNDPYARATTDFDTGAPLTFGIIPEAVISGTATGYQVINGQLQSAALSGVTVELTSGGNTVASTTTDFTGAFQFTGVAAGPYTVQQQVPSGYEQVAPFTISPNLNPVLSQAGSPLDAVAVADFNGDGNLDFAAHNTHTSNLEYAFGNGDGTFQAPQFLSTSFSAILDLRVGNFNGDQYPDLLLAANLTDVSYAYLAYGNGTGFANLQLAFSKYGGIGTGFYGVAVGDFDEDGKDDFAWYGQTTQYLLSEPLYQIYFVEVILAINQFSGQPTAITVSGSTTSLAPLPPLLSHALAAGDLNQDGNLDLFLNFGGDGNGTVLDWIAYGQGNGIFGHPIDSFAGSSYGPDLSIPVPFNNGPMALGDLNGDGILDAVTLGFSSGQEPQFVNFMQQTRLGTWDDLDGNFSSANNFVLGFNAASTGRTFFIPQLDIADVNGDGQVDVILPEAPNDGLAGQILTYLNQGNTSGGLAIFNSNTHAASFFFTTLANGARPSSLALGDFNKNGLTDLLVGELSAQGGGLWELTNTSRTAINPAVNAANGEHYVVDFKDFTTAGVGGAVYADEDGNGQKGPGEGGSAGETVFFDRNGNGKFDSGEPFARTNEEGLYVLSGLLLGEHGRVAVLGGNTPETVPGPQAGYDLVVDHNPQRFNFALRPRLLQALGGASVSAGEEISLQARLTPGVQHAAHLVFTLAAGAPAGMHINPVKGLLTWTPAITQTPGVYSVKVQVRDYLEPLVIDSQNLDIAVLPPGSPLSGFEQTPLVNVALVSFNQPDGPPASALAATIDWGDGSPRLAGGITLSQGAYTISGSHTYQDAQTYPITIELASVSPAFTTTFRTSAVIRLLLPDGTVGTPNQRFLAEVYRDLLGRQVDAAGLAVWNAQLTAGATRSQVVRAIENTDEFRAREVDQLYQQYLNRSAYTDAFGMNTWVTVLRLGQTVEQVAAAIVQSPEYQQRWTNGTFNSWLDAFYADALGRAVDAGGRAAWNTAFQAGQSRQQIAQAIYTARTTDGSGNEYQANVVDFLYERLLGRTSRTDPTATTWAAALQRGALDEDVIAAIAGSEEFFGRAVP